MLRLHSPDARSHAPRATCALLAVSGAAALAYEVVWFKLLALHAGADTGTLAALLAGFLGGLGLGGWAIRRPAERARRPLLLLAGLEAAAAALGALSPWVFPAAFGLLDQIGGPLSPDQAEGPLARFLAAFLVAIPACIMGALLPVAVRAAVRDPSEAGRGAARIYGWNTLGGAAGAAAAGFLLLPGFGLSGTLFLAAGVQAGVALAAVALSRRLAPRRDEAEPGIRPPAPPPASADLLGACALAGSAALVSEVAWTQIFAASFGSTAYALAAVLAVYLAGIGIGSFLPATSLDRVARPAVLLGLLQIGAATAILLLIPVLGRLPLWVGSLSSRGSDSPFVLYACEGLLAGVALLPLTALLGASFPVACRALGALGAGEHVAVPVGSAAAANMAGALAGILAGRTGVEAFGLRRALMLAALLHATAAALALARRASRLPRPLAAGSCAALALAAVLAQARWDPNLLSSGAYLRGPLFAAGAALGGTPLERQAEALGRLRFYRESSEGVVSVREGWDGTLSLAVNGRTEASSGADLASQLWIGHLPALLRPQARSAVLVGLASGFTLAALARHALERIDCVELSAAVAAAAAQFDSLTGAPLREPRVRLHLADARRWLARHPGPYDLIVSQPSNFWVAGVSGLFTREFFERARARLAPGGVMAVWVQAYAIDPEDFRAVLATFRDVFPGATLWEEALAGGDYFLIGSAQEQPFEWGQVADSLVRAGVREHMRLLGVRELGDLLAHQVAGARGLERLSRQAARVTDDNLRLEFTAPLHLRRPSVPEVVQLLEQAGPRGLDLSSISEAARRRALERLARRDRQRERDRQVLALLAAEAEDLSAEPRLFMAATLLASGWRRAAARELESLLSDQPQRGLAWLLLGAARLGDPEAGGRPAAVALERAVALRPADATAWNLLGRARALGGERAAARAAFDRALALRPDFAAALNNRAALALEEDRASEALVDLERALALDRTSVPLRVNLGLALRRLGRAADSRRVYEEGLALEPDHPDLHFNLATLELAEKRPARALEHYRRAAALGGSDAQTERGQGLALLALGRRSEALPHLEESLRLDPAQADLARLLRSLKGGRETRR